MCGDDVEMQCWFIAASVLFNCVPCIGICVVALQQELQAMWRRAHGRDTRYEVSQMQIDSVLQSNVPKDGLERA